MDECVKWIEIECLRDYADRIPEIKFQEPVYNVLGLKRNIAYK
jgi:hypothetical protein